MKIQCSYCNNELSFSKGDLFNSLAKHGWRVFGINVGDNSNYYICQKCRELKKINLPLYTPPALAKAMKEKFDNCKPNRNKEKLKEKPVDIISVKI